VLGKREASPCITAPSFFWFFRERQVDMQELIKAIRYFFVESHIRWLLYILVIEYFIATNLSPTILSDYAIASYFVEKMSFLDAVHVFDNTAIHPESVSFFIALSFVLLIPKTISIYFFLQNNPYSEMSQLVITPYTKYKPSRALKAGEGLTEEDAKTLLTVERSMFSRIVWSLLSLGLAAGLIWMCLRIGVSDDRSLIVTQRVNRSIGNGGMDMWLSLSTYRFVGAALLTAVSLFIIKDYYRFFKELINKNF